MNKFLEERIIESISITTPFVKSDVKKVYKITKSFDNTIFILEECTRLAISPKDFLEIISSMNDTGINASKAGKLLREELLKKRS